MLVDSQQNLHNFPPKIPETCQKDIKKDMLLYHISKRTSQNFLNNVSSKTPRSWIKIVVNILITWQFLSKKVKYY